MLIKRFGLFLMILLSYSMSCSAAITVQKTDDGKKVSIKADNETLSSFLTYLSHRYSTTATINASIADDKFNASVTAKSLLTAVQRALRHYNCGMIGAEDGGIAHIAILPAGDAITDEKLLTIGKADLEQQQLRERWSRAYQQRSQRRHQGSKVRHSPPMTAEHRAKNRFSHRH